MRIDASTTSFLPDRTARPGSAVTPFREAQREIEQRREQPLPPVNTRDIEQIIQVRKGEANNRTENLPARLQSQLFQPPLNNRAAQALASYNSTARIASETETQQVLGLDIFA